jgi:hypothetical protein
MAAPDLPTSSGRSGSTAGAFGRAVQGLVLERFAVGVVLMGLVDLVAAFAEATGTARVLALVVGAGVVVVTVVGWRRRWSDSAMWAAMLVAGAAAFTAFVVAVASGG